MNEAGQIAMDQLLISNHCLLKTAGKDQRFMARISFQIFIAGRSNRNSQLVRLYEEACQSLLDVNTYEINVIDLTRHPQLAEKHKVLATPTILRSKPLPERRVIGGLNADGPMQALRFLIDDLKKMKNEKDQGNQ